MTINWAERKLDEHANEMHITARIWVCMIRTKEGDRKAFVAEREIQLSNVKLDRATINFVIALAHANEVCDYKIPLCKFPMAGEIRPDVSFIAGIAPICKACHRIYKRWNKTAEEYEQEYEERIRRHGGP